MFCPNCGTQFENETATCPNCGTVASQPAPEVPVAEAPVAAPEAEVFAPAEEVAAPAKKLNNKTIGLIGIGAIVLIIVLVLSIALSGGGALERPMKLSKQIMLDGKVKKIEDFYPKAYWTYMEEEEDTKVSDALKEFEEEFDEYFEPIDKALGKAYGDNYKVKYKITNKDKASSKALESIQDGLKDNYDIPKKNVKSAKELEIELTIKGKEDKDTEEIEVFAVKLNGDWYYVSESGRFADPSIILEAFMNSEAITEALMESADLD